MSGCVAVPFLSVTRRIATVVRVSKVAWAVFVASSSWKYVVMTRPFVSVTAGQFQRTVAASKVHSPALSAVEPGVEENPGVGGNDSGAGAVEIPPAASDCVA